MAMFGKRERKKEKRCKGKGKGKEKKKREKKRSSKTIQGVSIGWKPKGNPCKN